MIYHGTNSQKMNFHSLISFEFLIVASKSLTFTLVDDMELKTVLTALDNGAKGHERGR